MTIYNTDESYKFQVSASAGNRESVMTEGESLCSAMTWLSRQFTHFSSHCFHCYVCMRYTSSSVSIIRLFTVKCSCTYCRSAFTAQMLITPIMQLLLCALSFAKRCPVKASECSEQSVAWIVSGNTPDTTKGNELGVFGSKASNETYIEGLYVAFEETQRDSRHSATQSSADLETFISSGARM